MDRLPWRADQAHHGPAAALTRLLSGMLFGLTTYDAPTYLVVVLVMLGTATLASYVPAHRASRVDPLESLRHD